MVGSPNVGKTSLLARYVDNKFSEEYHQTIGANFLIKEIDLKEIIDKINISKPELKKDIKDKGFKLCFHLGNNNLRGKNPCPTEEK
ncbi:MAG: hypothetical protein WBH31_10705 [Promethearchaeia archaeon]